ncbi:hypothetical protein [Saccharolobus caldissimus]|uniref:Uncharacterized protein n=1 Tax=Saccharolobus caldissimus TaxID=1702097 RepID=A0AAQ4CS72_9CREN|nr:hypothetical protein [Saccharolobus caldissimus]BDB98653.1 hypothetical protein SACC_16700 [Saccharolobus caldissimus]
MYISDILSIGENLGVVIINSTANDIWNNFTNKAFLTILRIDINAEVNI